MVAQVETDADFHIKIYERDGTIYQHISGRGVYRLDDDGLTKVSKKELWGDWTDEDGYVSDDADWSDEPRLLATICDDHNNYSGGQ